MQASETSDKSIARKKIAVHSEDGSILYYATNHTAYELVQIQQYQWLKGDKAIIRLPKPMHPNMGATWQVKQSGYAGPLVLQVNT